MSSQAGRRLYFREEVYGTPIIGRGERRAFCPPFEYFISPTLIFVFSGALHPYICFHVHVHVYKIEKSLSSETMSHTTQNLPRCIFFRHTPLLMSSPRGTWYGRGVVIFRSVVSTSRLFWNHYEHKECKNMVYHQRETLLVCLLSLLEEYKHGNEEKQYFIPFLYETWFDFYCMCKLVLFLFFFCYIWFDFYCMCKLVVFSVLQYQLSIYSARKAMKDYISR